MTTSPYQAPVTDMTFVMGVLDGFAQPGQRGPLAELGMAMVGDVLAEAARFAEQRLAPLYHSADRAGVSFAAGRVTVPDEIKRAYLDFVTAGWPSLAGPAEYGGQGLPQCVAVAVAEMWRSANLAFALCPMLTSAAAEAVLRHGSETLKAGYAAKLVSGEWSGTMNLTEAQAGSDLSLISTMASPSPDGYRLRGRKVFITWGDHDLTENIVHLVLARTPDAPAGVKGLSLFLVPKRLPAVTGGPSAPNDIATLSIEHKLGIHASPTCVMSYGDAGGASAWLVGKSHGGLDAMFTMMNQARLAVGVEGLGVAERAYQKALAYARERLQGSLPGVAGPVAIIRHPDVRRMLITMKSFLQAMRTLAYWGAFKLDLATRDAAAAGHAALLTPVIKAWCTESAQEVVSLGLQVHGGAGYIEETGAAQLFRDARITTIYEGTTGIQANDFLRRKLIPDEARAARALLGDFRHVLAADAVDAGLRVSDRERLGAALDAVDQALAAVMACYRRDALQAAGVAVPLLMSYGTLLGGCLLVRCAAAAARELRGSCTEARRAYLQGQCQLTEFYIAQILPRAQSHAAAAEAGATGDQAFPDILL